MRKTFVLLVLPLFVMSCQKQYCWECDIATAGGLTYKEQICDRTKKQIKDMQENPLETKDNTGAVKYITTFSNCVRR
jgi:hypothetical protein